MMSERIFNFHDVFLIITIVECLLLALYRMALPSSRRIDNIVLGLFLFTVAMDATSTLVMWNELFPIPQAVKQWVLPYIFIGSQLALGPLFFLYVRAMTDANFALSRRQAIHFIPTALGLVAIAAWGVRTGDLQMFSGNEPRMMVGRTLWYIAVFVSIAYGIGSLVATRRYYMGLKENYSDFSAVETGWLSVLAGGFLINWSWSLVIIMVADLVGGGTANTFGTAHNYIRFLLLNALFAYSLLYTHRILVYLSDAADNPGHQDEERPGGEVLSKIQRGIEVQKLHLEPNINIEEFSSRINLPVKTVSYAINNELGTKFFEFINYHRVEEAKALLADESKVDLTVLDILMLAGFSNKSSFHRFFKRMVDMSPTEYRRSQLSGRARRTSEPS